MNGSGEFSGVDVVSNLCAVCKADVKALHIPFSAILSGLSFPYFSVPFDR